MAESIALVAFDRVYWYMCHRCNAIDHVQEVVQIPLSYCVDFCTAVCVSGTKGPFSMRKSRAVE